MHGPSFNNGVRPSPTLSLPSSPHSVHSALPFVFLPLLSPSPFVPSAQGYT
jgi:hypothetical protein